MGHRCTFAYRVDVVAGYFTCTVLNSNEFNSISGTGIREEAGAGGSNIPEPTTAEEGDGGPVAGEAMRGEWGIGTTILMIGKTVVSIAISGNHSDGLVPDRTRGAAAIAEWESGWEKVLAVMARIQEGHQREVSAVDDVRMPSVRRQFWPHVDVDSDALRYVVYHPRPQVLFRAPKTCQREGLQCTLWCGLNVLVQCDRCVRV